MSDGPRARPALVELTLARVREFLREPEAIFWVFAFPVLLAVALGLAFREKPPDRMPVGVIEGAGSAEILASLSRSPSLQPRLYTEARGREGLRTGKISLLIVPDASKPGLVYLYDPTRPDARTARLEVDDALQRASGRADVLTAKDELVKEPGSRYIDFLIPGLLGMNLMGTGIWGIGFSIVSARTRKLLKRLVATPMRRSDYLVSQMLARLVFLVAEVAILVAFGWIAFGVAVNGSLVTLTFTCLLGAAAFCGLGLLVASRAQTIEAVSGLGNLVMVPMWLLSGVFFSSERFPDAAQPLIRALPLTALNEALRAVMTEGRPLSGIVPQLLILSAWGLTTFALALRIFRWK